MDQPASALIRTKVDSVVGNYSYFRLPNQMPQTALSSQQLEPQMKRLASLNTTDREIQ